MQVRKVMGWWMLLCTVSLSRCPPVFGPNEKAGDLTPQGEILYRVFFENLPDATAPARLLLIEDVLDPNLDWSTFRFRHIEFGSNSFDVEDQGLRFSLNTIVDVEGQELEVDLFGELDPQRGIARWFFETITEDPLPGFLPPGEGGFVSFMIRPLPELIAGEVVENQALLQFDFSQPLLTNPVFIEIGFAAPEPPANPRPPDGALVQPGVPFCWEPAAAAEFYEVFVWRTSEPRPRDPEVTDLAEACWFPWPLEPGEEYLWQVIAINGSGETPGPVWSFATSVADLFQRGNSDGFGGMNISDAVFILGHLFLGLKGPSCRDAADANDDGVLDLTDGIFILSFLFLGGPPPPTPFESCGPDPTEDSLSCDAFPPCAG